MRPTAATSDPRTCSISPRTPGGAVTPARLASIAAVAGRFAVPLVKIMSSQRILLMGVPAEQAGAVLAALAREGVPAEVARGHGGVQVQACPGSRACPNGQQDTIAMAELLEERLGALARAVALPAKVRAGISGCPRCCGESYVRDIGLVGRKGGWTLAFGGNAGARPRAADELASGLNDAEALDLLERALSHYAANARKNQRTARFMEVQGIATLREALGLAPAPGTPLQD